MSDYRKAITYTGQKIKGPVDVSLKIDGIRLITKDGKTTTRSGKVPRGLEQACTADALDKLAFWEDCELYTGVFKDVQGPTSQLSPTPNQFTAEHIYSLSHLDGRLYITTVEGLVKDAPLIPKLLEAALADGYEGLVLRTADKWYRVKPYATADVYITGWFEQHDKHGEPKGQLGGFTTNYGKVTAFTEEMRKELWDKPEQYVGEMMSVQYKELYDTGSFRFAVKFLHFRDDKDEESFDTGGNNAEML